jgi:hypothetical protein
MRRVEDLGERLEVEVGIDLRRGDARLPAQHLDRAQMQSILARRDAQTEAREEDPVEVTVALTLTIDEDSLRRFNEELRRVETAMLSP